ncbi:MAG: PAS domain S-box protein [Rhodobacteraceae bacterium]|nr:PAS domain S-box protein [Paracoccaceae bacterium]
MSDKSDKPTRRWRIYSALSVVGVLATAILAAVLLNGDIRRKIDALATANSDSAQWSLAQADVELLALNSAILSATSDPTGSLNDLRNRYDVFYSRARTLMDGSFYDPMRQDQDVKAALMQIDSYLARTVPIIDSSNVELRSALPDLAQQTDAVRKHVRAVTLKGVTILAASADAQRFGIAQTLSWVSALTLLVLLILIVMLALLMRHFRRERAHAREQSIVRSRLAAVVSTSLDGVLVVDRQGRIMDYNGAAERIFGYSRAEAIGAEMENMIVPDHFREAHRNGMKRYLTTGEKRVVGTGLIQLEAKRKNGEVFPVELSISSAESDDGEIFVSFIRDISDRVAAETELVKARDDAVAGERAKADFIAVMSHEMRTPLNGMLGTLDLLDGNSRSAKEQEYIEIIRASGKLLQHHVDNVLELSRAEAERIETTQEVFSLPQLVRELTDGQRSVAQHRGNALEVSISEVCDDPVIGDPTRVRQILLNLVGNAIKFTRDGRIDITVSRPNSDNTVEIAVSDTGLGIAPEDQTKVFEDFVTLDASYSREIEGTGLGLAIVKRVVDALNGQIELDSVPGKGSSFRVTLPLPQADEDQIREASPSDDTETRSEKLPQTGPLRVLIVEDNRINRIVLRDLLEQEGHHVEEAHDGEQGVAQVQAARGQNVPYDLVLMDISMPKLDGVGATQAIRAIGTSGARLPIVAVTAHAVPSELERFRKAGMDDVLVKPISRDGLSALLRRVSDLGSQVSDRAYSQAGNSVPVVLDKPQIQDLVDALGQAKVRTLVQDFLDETDPALIRICHALRTVEAEPDQDKSDLVALVHHTAGSAALLGAIELRARLAAVETNLNTATPVAPETADQLLDIWSQTKDSLIALTT